MRNSHTSDNLNLGDAVRVSEDDTDLGWGSTLLGELADLVDDLLGGGLEPRRSSAGVWDGRGRYTLSIAVKTTHDEFGGVAGIKFVGWRLSSRLSRKRRGRRVVEKSRIR